MKQAISTPYKSCIFRETFNSEADVRRINNGVPSNVDFSNGVGSFNGISSRVLYPCVLNGIYSIRIKLKSHVSVNYKTIIYFSLNRNISEYPANNINIVSGATNYVNGSPSSTLVNTSTDIVVTGFTLSGVSQFYIGSTGSTNYFKGVYELVEIYEGVLTPSEVKNLYNDTWNKELPPNNLLLDFNSTNGVLDLGDYTNTATATAVTLHKTG